MESNNKKTQIHVTCEKDKFVILDNIAQEFLDEYTPKLNTKVAKRNFRTLENLERSVVEGMNDALDELVEVTEIEVIEKIGREKIHRSVFYYMNEPLVYKLVRKFDNLPIPEEDRLSAAQKGFVTALNLFDPSRGFQFSTFAYHLIVNEIIALNKERKKQSTITYKARDILAPNDLKIVRIEKSVGHRLIRINKEIMTLYNVTTVQLGTHSEYTYHYLYLLDENVQVGNIVKLGERLGTLAGAEVDLQSVESHIEGDKSGETIFINPTDNKSENYRRPDTQASRVEIGDLLRKVVSELDERERLLIQNRILPVKLDRMSLKDLSEETGIPQGDLKLFEERTLLKIRKRLEEFGVDASDLESFE